jgi:hypothetical protein
MLQYISEDIQARRNCQSKRNPYHILKVIGPDSVQKLAVLLVLWIIFLKQQRDESNTAQGSHNMDYF